MTDLQICVFHTFLTILILQRFSCLVQACSSGCTCTTVPEKSEEYADNADAPTPTDDDDTEDVGMPQATKGRKVNCSNNPYRFSSIEDLNRAITIPLDTIYL